MSIGQELAKCDEFNIICFEDPKKGLNLELYKRSTVEYCRFILRTILKKATGVIVSSQSNLIFLLFLSLTRKGKILLAVETQINPQESRVKRTQGLVKFQLLSMICSHFLALNKSSMKLLRAKRIKSDQVSYFPQSDLPKYEPLATANSSSKVIVAMGFEGVEELFALQEISAFELPDRLEILVECSNSENEKALKEELPSNKRCKVQILSPSELRKKRSSHVDLFIDLNPQASCATELLHFISNGVPCICSDQNTLAAEVIDAGVNGFLYNSSGNTMLIEEIKIGLYFTQPGKRMEMAMEVKQLHNPAYREKLVASLLNHDSEHVNAR